MYTLINFLFPVKVLSEFVEMLWASCVEVMIVFVWMEGNGFGKQERVAKHHRIFITLCAGEERMQILPLAFILLTLGRNAS